MDANPFATAGKICVAPEAAEHWFWLKHQTATAAAWATLPPVLIWHEPLDKKGSKATNIFCDEQIVVGNKTRQEHSCFQVTFQEYLDLVPVLCTKADFTCNK